MSDDLEAGVRIGDFRIERRLGAGGMGVVYLATQASPERLVALKLIGSALRDESAIARFRREAQAVGKLDHPGIARVHFIGQDGRTCYIAMEYIDGASLREVVRRLAAARRDGQSIDSVVAAVAAGGDEAPTVRFDQATVTFVPQPGDESGQAGAGLLTPEAKRLMASPDHVRRCCEVVRDAAWALAHAHGRGVVHRDVKPDNLLLDRRGHAHLIDFGLARFLEDMTLTNTGALVGTPMYMSPEQVTGRIGLDHRTDIYSLGLVLYELLTLGRPISAPTREGILRQIVTKPLPPVSRGNPGVSRDLQGVVHTATAKDPDGRYQTASEFAADLQNVLDRRPVAAAPYRYEFDRREIQAERPTGVTVASFAFFFVSILSLVVAAVAVLIFLPEVQFYGRSFYAFLAACLATSLLGSGIGCGLLSGRTPARWVAAGVCAASAAASAGLFTLSLAGPEPAGGPTLALFYGLLFVLMIAIVFILVRPRTRAWFDLASRLRSEHKRPMAS
jgi:serine/threonine protein kinase